MPDRVRGSSANHTPRSDTAGSAAVQVAAIVAAAEDAAERLRARAEDQVRERIAEGERAAENRVNAGEQEAAEIVAAAHQDAVAIRQEADAYAIKVREDADARVRELVRDARTVVSDVRTEGLELNSNLRDMGASLRTNAERLLRDIQMIHASMVAELDRIDGGASGAQAGAGRRASGSVRAVDQRRAATSGRDARPLPATPPDGDVLDVPEFIPPS